MGPTGTPKLAPPSDPTSSSSSNQQRRLSRLSPSEFDNILDSTTTRRLDTSRDENLLGISEGLPPSPDPSLSFSSPPTSPANSPSLSRTAHPGGRMVTPPGLTPEPSTPESVKRRSMFRSVGNASSPDLSSLLKKARGGAGRIGGAPGEVEEEEVLAVEGREGGEVTVDASAEAGGAYEDADESLPDSPVKAKSPPRPARGRASTSPTIPRVSPRLPPPPLPASPPTSSCQLSVPDSRDSTLASRSSSTGGKPRLSAISTFSSGSYVHVPLPRGAKSAGPESSGGRGGLKMGVGNASVSSLGAGIGFDFSPNRRKKSDAGEGEDGRLSIAGTMRKTSRFFRKFGGGGSTTTFSKGIGPNSSPNTPASTSFATSAFAPPVPLIPATYSRSPPSSAAPSQPAVFSLPPHRNPSRSRERSAGEAISIQSSSSPAFLGSPASQEMGREGSGQSLAPSELSVKSGRSRVSSTSRASSSPNTSRRRSASFTSPSLTPAIPSHSSPVLPSKNNLSPPSSSSRKRIPSGRAGEDDQLQRELRQWRLGVDGVLGVGAGGTPSPGTSPTLKSSSRMGRTTADGSPTAVRKRVVSAVMREKERRPSLPETAEGKALPGLPPSVAASLAQRSASLPTSALLPPRPSSASSASSRAASPLIPKAPPSPADSASTLPAPHTSSARGLTPPPLSKRHSIADPEALGLGLAALDPVAEGLHSRDGSALGTPVKGGYGGGGKEELATPLAATAPRLTKQSASPNAELYDGRTPFGAGGGAGGPSNQRHGVTRASIVGYPSTANTSSSSILSPVGLSTSSPARPGPAARAKSKKQREEEELSGLSEEVVEAKAKVLAERCWDEDETFLERRKIAEWLGSAGRLNVAALRHYIDNFEFTGLRLDVAFRRLCTKLYLKAETQQVDRILEQFSRRFFEGNPRTVYGSADTVHAVSYSLLLLNTDLHVVDTQTRMTRQQFIRNTLEAIQAQQEVESAQQQFPTAKLLFSSAGTPSASSAEVSSVFGSPEASESRKSLERPRTAASVRSGFGTAKDSPTSSSQHLPPSPALSRTGSAFERPSTAPTPVRSESLATVNSTLSSASASKTLEANLQATLKDMYNAIKSQPIYQNSSSSASASALHLPDSNTPSANSSRPSLNLAPGGSPYATWSGGGNVNRSASKRSGHGAGPNSANSSVGSNGSSYKRASIRGMGAFLGAGNSSLELSRTTSPTPSTMTSMSDDHYSGYGGSSQHHAVPTIGFANSLSHTIIREQQEENDAASHSSSLMSVSSAELALLGAPWAKEGMLSRKHYWETSGKRAKDKNWVQAFVVVSAGELKMFRFDSGGGTRSGVGGMGGGDWTANASSVGSISLTHALCSAMPAPGYSRERPHCFVLTLPNGGSYFFQAGTPDLVGEWVATCNYWAARLSKEPLSGGVSNMEYGWNRAEPPSSSQNDDDEYEEIASIRSGHSRVSRAESSFSYGSGSGSNNGNNDRIHINDWKSPQVPLTPSNLPEEVQLDALRRHGNIVKKELALHTALRPAMIRLYSSRSSNHSKAVANWERKSQHLMTESVKWATYIDALSSAIRLRSIQRGKKEVEAMLESADADGTEDEDDDELASRLSPYDEGPAPSVAHIAAIEGTDESTSLVLNGDDEIPRSPRNKASQVSVGTATTAGDEFFESNSHTPPPGS